MPYASGTESATTGHDWYWWQRMLQCYLHGSDKKRVSQTLRFLRQPRSADRGHLSMKPGPCIARSWLHPYTLVTLDS